MAAMKDKALLEDAKKLRLDISPATGEEVAGLVRDIYASPKSLVAKVRAVSVKPDDMKVTVKELPVVTVSTTLKHGLHHPEEGRQERRGAVLRRQGKGPTGTHQQRPDGGHGQGCPGEAVRPQGRDELLDHLSGKRDRGVQGHLLGVMGL
jgi:hypothetical protein